MWWCVVVCGGVWCVVDNLQPQGPTQPHNHRRTRGRCPRQSAAPGAHPAPQPQGGAEVSRTMPPTICNPRGPQPTILHRGGTRDLKHICARVQGFGPPPGGAGALTLVGCVPRRPLQRRPARRPPPKEASRRPPADEPASLFMEAGIALACLSCNWRLRERSENRGSVREIGLCRPKWPIWVPPLKV